MDVMPRVFPIVSLFQSTSKRWEREKSRQQSAAIHGRNTARATSARAPAAAASSAARPQRRLSLSLEPEAAEHDRVRGRQAEGKDEQRPFVRSNTTALHTMALARLGSH